jgi:alcohol dehydrogenase, propanol-preferring
MKGWMIVAASEPLEEIEIPTPVPQGAEVLVEVTHCGVCHSDLHFWKGEYNMGGGQVMKLADRGVTLPRAPGHEIAGRVVALGPDARGVAIGDLRVVYPWLGCGECAECNSERDNMCLTPRGIGTVRDGGFSSHVLVPHARYLFDPGNVDLALAATYACSGLTCHSAVSKVLPLEASKPVLIIGAGGIGLMMIAMLKAFGHDNIVTVDIDPAKRAAALAAGAGQVIDGNGDDLAARVLAACGPVAVAFDCVNRDSTARAALDCLGKGGKLVLVGVAGGDLQLSLAAMIFRAQSVIGNNTGSPADLRAVLELANSGKLAPTPVTCCPHDAANQTLLDLKHGKFTGRAVLVREAAGSDA